MCFLCGPTLDFLLTNVTAVERGHNTAVVAYFPRWNIIIIIFQRDFIKRYCLVGGQNSGSRASGIRCVYSYTLFECKTSIVITSTRTFYIVHPFSAFCRWNGNNIRMPSPFTYSHYNSRVYTSCSVLNESHYIIYNGNGGA